MERGLTKNQAISLLIRSSHGKLEQYLPVGKELAAKEPEFFAHLIAWNQQKGTIRDSKVALPVIQAARKDPGAYNENALAHLALLDPRNLVRAVRLGKGLHLERPMFRLVERYLREREKNWSWWERTALQHRASMKELYALTHTKPSAMADQILFKREFPRGTVFGVVRELASMSAGAAAAEIIKRRIPFLVAQGALGARMKEVDLQLALIKGMSPTELVTNAKTLERWGVKNSPVTRAALEEALEKAAKSKKQVLKASTAAKALGEGVMRSKMEALQERQLGRGSVEGNWLVLGDRSPSMQLAIQVANEVAAILTRSVKGEVRLVFFDGTVHKAFDCTGASYDTVIQKTASITAGGQGTSIGCGLAYALEKKWSVDGIAVVSDAKENTPRMFADVYGKLEGVLGKLPPVYLYRVQTGMTGYGDTDLADTMRAAGHEMQEFDLRGSVVDYHSLPNLVLTMRVQRYGLVEEIMETPLLTLDGVFKSKRVGASMETEVEAAI